MKKSSAARLARGAALCVVAFFLLFPIYWIIGISLKTRPDIFAWPPKYLFVPTLSNFQTVLFGNRSFLPNIRNSLLIATFSTVLSGIMGSLAGYSLSRYSFKRNRDVAFYILSTRMMPPIAVIIPFYLIMRKLQLIDTYLAIILAHTTFNLPLVTWMMKSFFDDLPREIEEAAKVDGCSPLGVFLTIALPLSAPGLAATTIFAFVFSWNEFLYALILGGFNTKTLPVAITGFQSSIGIRWGEMAAGTVVAILPVIIFSLFIQRYLIRGLTAGAVKE